MWFKSCNHQAKAACVDFAIKYQLSGWAGRITPGVLPSALRASLRLFKFAPGTSRPLLRVLIVTTFIHKRSYTSAFNLAGPGGLLRASCPTPFGPHFVRSNSLPANLSNLLSVLIFSSFIDKRSYTSALIFGWAGRIRTSECQDQNLVPYRLATAQYKYTLLPLPSQPGIRRFMPGSHHH